jgi:hypothetical protein
MRVDHTLSVKLDEVWFQQDGAVQQRQAKLPHGLEEQCRQVSFVVCSAPDGNP